MNKDNIQELLKPRYLVSTPWYPSNNYQSGDIVTPDKFTGWHPKYSPVIFRRLEWWEDRDVKDMPEYLKSNINDKNWYGNVVFEKVDMFYGDNNEYVALVDRDEMMQYCTSWYLPTTETEYLNQTNQP